VTLTAQLYTAITGADAPADLDALVARVVLRLEALLRRDIDADAPADLIQAVAFGVLALSAPAERALPAGVSSLDVAGEYRVAVATGQVTTADDTALPESLAYLADLGGRCVTLALRHRRVAL
jgi:hypothetical protein